MKDITTALKFFEEAATRHACATEKGDYKMGNLYYNKILKAIALLKKENAIDNLLKLLNNSSIGVRIWAATYILPYYEYEAIRVLEEISKSQDIHSLTAKTTIDEWKKGNLKL